ncbi:MAG: radical SAM protein [Deltaproteobacteria bacterium]|nr:radical SAM protein [Deltaproteobacteria bacterium]
MKQKHNTYLHNPAYLKIDLMLNGIRVGDETACVLGLNQGYEYSGITGGLDIMLPYNTWVNVPFLKNFVKNSPYELIRHDGKFFVKLGTESVKVKIIPKPEFYKLKTTTGIPLSKIGVVHGGYVAITPDTRCEFFNMNIECRYCAGNFNTGKGNVYTVEEVLETVEAAYKEGKDEVVYLSIGFSEAADGGIEFLKPYIKAIKKHFNTLVAVEALPPKENHCIDETYAVGADSVLYNMEIFDEKLFKEICPGRDKLIGRERYINALKYAAKVFPNGTVATHLIVGLEPSESTMKGIDFFTGIGVVPILPIYRPSGSAKLSGYKVPSMDEVMPVYGHLYHAVKRNKINTHWVRDISVITTPIEARFFAHSKSSKTLMERFYKTKLGLKAAWGLSTLRRKLRVKEVGEG